MADKTKVPIEMSPYNAISILSFCREFINDDLPDEYRYQAIKEAVLELELQLGRHLTDEQWEEILAENQVNQLIGKSPARIKYKLMDKNTIIDAIREEWIKQFGKLEDGRSRDGYFVIGFVSVVLSKLESIGDETPVLDNDQENLPELRLDESWRFLSNEKPTTEGLYEVLDKYAQRDYVPYGNSGFVNEPLCFFNGKFVKASDIVAWRCPADLFQAAK